MQTAISPLGARIKVQMKTHLIFQPGAQTSAVSLAKFSGMLRMHQTVSNKAIANDNEQEKRSK